MNNTGNAYNESLTDLLKEHSYLETGGDMGDQGTALMAMGIGHLLGVWRCGTPKNMLPNISDEIALKMAGTGLITIRAEE